MLDQKVLVLKLGSVDRLTPCSVKPLKVAALQHELGDDPVEDGALVRETLLVLPGGDRCKVGCSSGNNLRRHKIILMKTNMLRTSSKSSMLITP